MLLVLFMIIMPFSCFCWSDDDANDERMLQKRDSILFADTNAADPYNYDYDTDAAADDDDDANDERMLHENRDSLLF